MFGEVAPPYLITTTTKARKFLKIKPLDIKEIPARPYKVFTMGPADVKPSEMFKTKWVGKDKPFFVGEIVKGRKYKTIYRMTGKGTPMKIEDISKLPSVEKYLFGKIPILKEEAQLFRGDIFQKKMFRISKEGKKMLKVRLPKPGKTEMTYLTAGQMQKLYKTEGVKVWGIEAYFKGIPKTFPRARGKVPRVYGEITQLRKPIKPLLPEEIYAYPEKPMIQVGPFTITKDVTGIKVMKPSEIIKTPLGKTFAEQIKIPIKKDIKLPKQIQQLETPTMLPKLTPPKQVALKVRVVTKVKTGMLPRQATRFGVSSKEMTRMLSGLRQPSVTKTKMRETTFEKIVSRTIGKEKTIEKLREMQKFKPLQKQIPKLVQEGVSVPRVPFFVTRPPVKPKPPTTKMRGWLGWLPSLQLPFTSKSQAYIPYGKEARTKKWVKLSAEPMSKAQALGRMAFAIDKTISAKGKIKKVKGKVVDRTSSIWATSQHKFREYVMRKGKQIRTPNQFIEFRKFRIDTLGESKDLTLAKLLKQKGWGKKSGKKKKT